MYLKGFIIGFAVLVAGFIGLATASLIIKRRSRKKQELSNAS
jgi:hypothetical protein